MKLSDYNYELPKDLIAQEPLRERDKCRLMVMDRARRSIEDKIFTDIIDYLKPGDCLVLNNTRVIPARFYGKRKTGGRVEVFLLDIKGRPRALVRPSKKIKPGEVIELENGFHATVMENADAGRFVEFDADVEQLLKHGHVPLPPYITREDIPEDKENYQTVFASRDGATASPTAGLHFTETLLNRISENGVKTAYVTLHTSYGTFAPVKTDTVEDHKMHSEYFEIDKNDAEIINDAKKGDGRVIAVGTTSTRALESAGSDKNVVMATKSTTDLFIYPGYQCKIVDGIITNFHLPASTLLLLVSAFAGREFIQKAYKHAIEMRYRFFSYGDAMFIF